jgi:hypothetical protein
LIRLRYEGRPFHRATQAEKEALLRALARQEAHPEDKARIDAELRREREYDMMAAQAEVWQ